MRTGPQQAKELSEGENKKFVRRNNLRGQLPKCNPQLHSNYRPKTRTRPDDEDKKSSFNWPKRAVDFVLQKILSSKSKSRERAPDLVKEYTDTIMEPEYESIINTTSDESHDLPTFQSTIFQDGTQEFIPTQETSTVTNVNNNELLQKPFNQVSDEQNQDLTLSDHQDTIHIGSETQVNITLGDSNDTGSDVQPTKDVNKDTQNAVNESIANPKSTDIITTLGDSNSQIQGVTNLQNNITVTDESDMLMTTLASDEESTPPNDLESAGPAPDKKIVENIANPKNKIPIDIQGLCEILRGTVYETLFCPVSSDNQMWHLPTNVKTYKPIPQNFYSPTQEESTELTTTDIEPSTDEQPVEDTDNMPTAENTQKPTEVDINNATAETFPALDENITNPIEDTNGMNDNKTDVASVEVRFQQLIKDTYKPKYEQHGVSTEVSHEPIDENVKDPTEDTNAPIDTESHVQPTEDANRNTQNAVNESTATDIPPVNNTFTPTQDADNEPIEDTRKPTTENAIDQTPQTSYVLMQEESTEFNKIIKPKSMVDVTYVPTAEDTQKPTEIDINNPTTETFKTIDENTTKPTEDINGTNDTETNVSADEVPIKPTEEHIVSTEASHEPTDENVTDTVPDVKPTEDVNEDTQNAVNESIANPKPTDITIMLGDSNSQNQGVTNSQINMTVTDEFSMLMTTLANDREPKNSSNEFESAGPAPDTMINGSITNPKIKTPIDMMNLCEILRGTTYEKMFCPVPLNNQTSKHFKKIKSKHKNYHKPMKKVFTKFTAKLNKPLIYVKPVTNTDKSTVDNKNVPTTEKTQKPTEVDTNDATADTFEAIDENNTNPIGDANGKNDAETSASTVEVSLKPTEETTTAPTEPEDSSSLQTTEETHTPTQDTTDLLITDTYKPSTEEHSVSTEASHEPTEDTNAPIDTESDVQPTEDANKDTQTAVNESTATDIPPVDNTFTSTQDADNEPIEDTHKPTTENAIDQAPQTSYTPMQVESTEFTAKDIKPSTDEQPVEDTEKSTVDDEIVPTAEETQKPTETDINNVTADTFEAIDENNTNPIEDTNGTNDAETSASTVEVSLKPTEETTTAPTEPEDSSSLQTTEETHTPTQDTTDLLITDTYKPSTEEHSVSTEASHEPTEDTNAPIDTESDVQPTEDANKDTQTAVNEPTATDIPPVDNTFTPTQDADNEPIEDTHKPTTENAIDQAPQTSYTPMQEESTEFTAKDIKPSTDEQPVEDTEKSTVDDEIVPTAEETQKPTETDINNVTADTFEAIDENNTNPIEDTNGTNDAETSASTVEVSLKPTEETTTAPTEPEDSSSLQTTEETHTPTQDATDLLITDTYKPSTEEHRGKH
uniref:Uncharacterized protein n=1 Tax=Heliothis virescens TaxID=7102 RepID=A0A2A4K9T2_HELVI